MLSHVTEVTEALSAAEARGAVAHLVGPVRSRVEALDAIAAALDFPSWTGRNLDALFDALSDLSWQPDADHVLVWAGHGALAESDPDTYRALVAVLTDAAAAPYGRSLTVVLADH